MTTQTPAGRINIAMTGRAEIAKDQLKELLTDDVEGLTLMRLGVAYAIRNQLPAERDDALIGRPGDGQNVNVGSFDPTGEIRTLITALYPELSDPYAVAEILMSRGVIQLAQDLTDGTIRTLADAMYKAPD